MIQSSVATWASVVVQPLPKAAFHASPLVPATDWTRFRPEIAVLAEEGKNQRLPTRAATEGWLGKQHRDHQTAWATLHYSDALVVGSAKQHQVVVPQPVEKTGQAWAMETQAVVQGMFQEQTCFLVAGIDFLVQMASLNAEVVDLGKAILVSGVPWAAMAGKRPTWKCQVVAVV